MVALTVSEKEFDSTVIGSSKPVVVDFWAPWCPHCRRVNPIVEAISKDVDGRVVVAKVDVDENEDLKEMYGVESIPTFVIIKGGKTVDTFVGPESKDEIVAWMKKNGAY